MCFIHVFPPNREGGQRLFVMSNQQVHVFIVFQHLLVDKSVVKYQKAILFGMNFSLKNMQNDFLKWIK